MGFLFGKKTQINNTATAVGAVSVQNSAQGVPISIVYGTTRITGNNIWYGDFTAVPHTDTQSSGGGKGGGGGVTTSTTTYSYTVGIAIGLCEGPISGVGQVWEQKNITTEAALGLTGFLGGYAQSPWSYLVSKHPADAYNYRGLAYEATAAYDLAASTSLPNLSFEVGGLSGVYAQATPYSDWGGNIGFNSSHINLSGPGNLTGTQDGAAFFVNEEGNTSYNTGSWACKFTIGAIGAGVTVGIANVTPYLDGAEAGDNVQSYGYRSSSGNKRFNAGGGGAGVAYGATFTTGDVIDVGYDATNGVLHFFKNLSDQGAIAGVAVGAWYPIASLNTAAVVTADFSPVPLPSPGAVAWGPAYSTDMNPAYLLDDLLKSANYGVSFPVAQVGDLTAFANYCAPAGANIAISPAYVTQRPAMDIANELCQIGISAPFWSEGVLKVTPYCDANIGTFMPVTTVQYQLTDDDFLAPSGTDPIVVKRKRPADAFNDITIQIKDRSNNYNNYVVRASDQAAIDQYGPRPAPMVTLDAICVTSIGSTVAQAMLRRALYYLNTYEFTLGWKYARLESMDLVGLTDAGLGLNQTTVRIVSTEEDSEGQIKFTAEDFNPGVSNPAAVAVQAASGYIVNQDVSAGNASTPVIFQPPTDASGGAPQVWLGTSGGADWGGAEVWGSSDNTTYTKLSIVTAPARHGVLTANLPTHVDPDAVSTLSVDLTISAGALLTVPTVQADALATLSYVDGELLAYANCTLTSAYHYDVTYLRRGAYGTPIGTHLVASNFMRCDGALAKLAVDPAWVGTTLYVKLLSFNKTGGGLQTLAGVAATSYVVQPYIVRPSSRGDGSAAFAAAMG